MNIKTVNLCVVISRESVTSAPPEAGGSEKEGARSPIEGAAIARREAETKARTERRRERRMDDLLDLRTACPEKEFPVIGGAAPPRRLRRRSPPSTLPPGARAGRDWR